MANYYAFVRTNYFRVTDPDRFREIMEQCSAEDTIHIFEPEPPNTNLFGFGCYGIIAGFLVEDDYDLDGFYSALQSVLAEDDAILIFESGYEKLRYVTGLCTVITTTDIQCIDVRTEGLALARKMLGNEAYTTQTEY